MSDLRVSSSSALSDEELISLLRAMTDPLYNSGIATPSHVLNAGTIGTVSVAFRATGLRVQWLTEDEATRLIEFYYRKRHGR